MRGWTRSTAWYNPYRTYFLWSAQPNSVPVTENAEDVLVSSHVRRQRLKFRATLLSTGKRPDHALKMASVSAPPSCRLLFVSDHYTKVQYLVDTGAGVSVLPPTPANRRLTEETFPLQGANGSIGKVIAAVAM